MCPAPAIVLPHAPGHALVPLSMRESSMKGEGEIVKQVASESCRCGWRCIAALVCWAAEFLASRTQHRQDWHDAQSECLQGLQGLCIACCDDAYMCEVMYCAFA